MHYSGTIKMAGFCWTWWRGRNPAGTESIYKRVKTDDTQSIHAPKGFHDALDPSNSVDLQVFRIPFPSFARTVYEVFLGLDASAPFLCTDIRLLQIPRVYVPPALSTPWVCRPINHEVCIALPNISQQGAQDSQTHHELEVVLKNLVHDAIHSRMDNLLT